MGGELTQYRLGSLRPGKHSCFALHAMGHFCRRRAIRQVPDVKEGRGAQALQWRYGAGGGIAGRGKWLWTGRLGAGECIWPLAAEKRTTDENVESKQC